MKTYMVTVFHENEVTTAITLDDDEIPNEQMMVSRVLAKVDAGEAFFESVDGGATWEMSE